jgi:hypothetical protein
MGSEEYNTYLKTEKLDIILARIDALEQSISSYLRGSSNLAPNAEVLAARAFDRMRKTFKGSWKRFEQEVKKNFIDYEFCVAEMSKANTSLSSIRRLELLTVEINRQHLEKLDTIWDRAMDVFEKEIHRINTPVNHITPIVGTNQKEGVTH